VALLTCALGDDARLVRAAGSLGYAGIVVEAFGAGHVPAVVADAISELVKECPVVVASRTGAGSVLTATYGFPGSESDLAARGAILAGALDGPKSRLLLTILLATGADLDGVRDGFARFDDGATSD